MSWCTNSLSNISQKLRRIFDQKSRKLMSLREFTLMTTTTTVSINGLIFYSKSHFWSLTPLTKNVFLYKIIQLFQCVIDVNISINFDSNYFSRLRISLDSYFGTKSITKISQNNMRFDKKCLGNLL